ncbi:MAG: class B sortase [Propionibacteriaceae bacterium]|jgi:sortase B|nr:class B sortase [Propionibacteriaceae bacterium]
MRVRRVIAAVVLVVAVGAMGYGGYGLRAAQQVYAQGDAAYADLSVRMGRGPADPTQPAPGGPADVDFAALQAVGRDAVAWLVSPGTPIDYPVMRASDYGYYLTHLPDGTAGAYGSLFIDYNNPPDFSGHLTVVYGHHLKSGAMFGSLVGYKHQSYAEAHPTMYLTTAGTSYRLDLLYGVVVAAGDWRDRAFMFEDNLDSLLAYAAAHTTFTSGVTYTPGDHIVALSTCSYEFEGARYVVLGVLRPV